MANATKALKGIALFVFFIIALLLQNGPPISQAENEKNKPQQGQSEEKHDGKPDHDKQPCMEDDRTGKGQGYCYKHIRGSWVGDAQNYPSCTGGYVCNSPGALCSDVSHPSGHCTLSPNSGTCNCQCL